MNLLKSTFKSFLIFSIILTIITFIYTILIYNNIINSEPNNIRIFSFITGIILFFIVGLISGKSKGNNGWLKGLITGTIIYGLIIIIKSLQNNLNDYFIFIKIITNLLSSTLGGILGINFKRKRA